MSAGIYQTPFPENEFVLSYAPGTAERQALQDELVRLRGAQADIPMYIGAREIRTKTTVAITPPHEHQHVLGHFHEGDATHVQQAIDAALAAKPAWEAMSWEDRAAIFLKAAELLAGPYRMKINATTMLGQSKNVFQAEVDAACELIDFLRFNVAYMQEIMETQPESSSSIWNRIEYRALEGFVFAITPFNFTSIAANLACAPALMGNTVVWKPAYPQIYSAQVVMEVLAAAGLPEGVINLIYVDGPIAGDIIFHHPEFAGLHFTGSTHVFRHLWQTIGQHIAQYRSYPRVVGETGGKDFIVAHASADIPSLVAAIIRGAFEYQGQKCSAASRLYIPTSLWQRVKGMLLEDIHAIKMGGVEDFSNFMNAMITQQAFEKTQGYIRRAQKNKDATCLCGGGCDASEGYFVEPTVLQAHSPHYETMEQEIFGPVLTVYVYEEKRFEEVLALVDSTSPYALTGAVFATDRRALAQATTRLRHAAGNLYLNDKPTGAVVGQQPFGGARGSGTNDKAGAAFHLLRWTSARTIKEVFVPPTRFEYPFMR